MKTRSRAALALACLFALLPLGACEKRMPDSANGNDVEVVLPEAPPQETTPPVESELPEETPPAEILPEKPEETPPVTAPSQPEPEEPKSETVEYLRVKANSLNIRKSASASSALLGAADKGALLAYEGRTGNWYKTRYKNQTAYVHADYAEIYAVPLTDGDAAEAVIKRGFDLLGTKYVYGAVRYHDGKGNKLSGFTTSAFDCSSFMQYIFLQGANVLLDVTTRTQILQGKRVDDSDLRRGDLMFFTNASRKNNTGIERVGHVGLYLGDGYVLHTASDYARAERLTQDRWNFYLIAKRVIE